MKLTSHNRSDDALTNLIRHKNLPCWTWACVKSSKENGTKTGEMTELAFLVPCETGGDFGSKIEIERNPWNPRIFESATRNKKKEK